MRIALGIQYNGSGYHGWQKQAHTKQTVEGHLSEAIAKIANHSVQLYCAGRTDAGVHATGQVVHFDTDACRENHAWLFGINSKLPKDISLQWVHPISDDFHARFSAKSRKYRYLIHNTVIPSAITAKQVTHYRYLLDAEVMNQAAQCLLGEHDFSSFRAAHCQSKSSFRCVKTIDITRKRDYIIIDICANAFLYHMVRNIVGSLMSVGQGRQSIDWFSSVFLEKNRQLAAPTAPADGLYLMEVAYDNRYNIPSVDFPLLIGE